MESKKYYFGEKAEEYDAKEGKSIPVWVSPKYEQARDKAIEIIDSNKYGIATADFWILMNKTKTGKMAYTGLILSHNGCLKVNDSIENKVNSKCFNLDKEGFNNSLVYTYNDDDIYEVGEVNKDNCKNEYPYAMAFKRCFDRVVLKKSKLAFYGIYSEVEADEFKENVDDTKNTKPTKEEQEGTKTVGIPISEQQIKILVANSENEIVKKALEYYKKEINQLTITEASTIIKKIINKKEKE